MCDPDFEYEMQLAMKRAEMHRAEAIKRAQIANKCDALKAVDRAIEAMKGGRRNPCIGEVLRAALCEVENANAGEADTVRRLLALEGW